MELLVRLAEDLSRVGRFGGHYRLRTGDYRLQFRAEMNRVIVEQAASPDGFYEEGDA